MITLPSSSLRLGRFTRVKSHSPPLVQAITVTLKIPRLSRPARESPPRLKRVQIQILKGSEVLSFPTLFSFLGELLWLALSDY